MAESIVPTWTPRFERFVCDDEMRNRNCHGHLSSQIGKHNVQIIGNPHAQFLGNLKHNRYLQPHAGHDNSRRGFCGEQLADAVANRFLVCRKTADFKAIQPLRGLFSVSAIPLIKRLSPGAQYCRTSKLPFGDGRLRAPSLRNLFANRTLIRSDSRKRANTWIGAADNNSGQMPAFVFEESLYFIRAAKQNEATQITRELRFLDERSDKAQSIALRHIFQLQRGAIHCL